MDKKRDNNLSQKNNLVNTMKIINTLLICSLILSQSAIISFAQEQDINQDLSTDSQKLGYALGVDMGKSLLKMNPSIDFDSLLNGVKDAYNCRPLLIQEKNAIKIKADFRKKRLQANKINQIRKQKINEEEKKSPEERAASKPAYNLDFSMVDQTTAENAAWSFVILHNNIMPVYTEKHFAEICKIMAAKSFDQECKELLANRLIYLKKEVTKITKGSFMATFSQPEFKQLPDEQNEYEISWIETFKPQNDTKINHNKKLDITLVNTKAKWRVKSAVFIK